MPLANVLLLEGTEQNLEEADMVFWPDLIDEILEKNKKRVNKKIPTVKAVVPNIKLAKSPQPKKDNTSKIIKSITDLFKPSKKGGETYYGNYDSTGADVRDYGDFGDFSAQYGLNTAAKGGSIKKGVKKGMKKGTKKSAKKSTKKRAALRGQRSELRGS